MTRNTISLVSRLIWKRYRWKFIDIFENVSSLQICFSADSFHLFCCITPCESSGRFFRATRYNWFPNKQCIMRPTSFPFGSFVISKLVLNLIYTCNRYVVATYAFSDVIVLLWRHFCCTCLTSALNNSTDAIQTLPVQSATVPLSGSNPKQAII